MKSEKRPEIAMKLMQFYGTKALLYLAIVLGAVLFITLLAQALALAFYAAAFLATVCAVGYFYHRITNGPTDNPTTEPP